jgi:hypothetical protein
MLDERHDTNCREGQIKKEEAEKGWNMITPTPPYSDHPGGTNGSKKELNFTKHNSLVLVI